MEDFKMLKLNVRILVLCVMLAVIPSAVSKHKNKNLSRLMTDSLSKTRCDLLCSDVVKNQKSECRDKCKIEEIKPGKCSTNENSKWAQACVESCNADYQCDGMEKCCQDGCSKVCSQPEELLSLPGLPALPSIAEPYEKKKAVIVKWSDGVGDLARAVPGKILYILEEQHHMGPKYEEQRLKEWNTLLRTNKTKVILHNAVKPGHWYRFRVAAVSASGSRGFSAPSLPFTPRRGPRPPSPPKRLRVQPFNADNGTLSVRLEWKEPPSDLPIIRYKVYWSRRVMGLGSELDSVLVNHQSVSKEQKYFDIHDLQPNSMYFMQVQTISQYGLGKLRSDKASIFYNTTITDTLNSSTRKAKKIKNLKLRKLFVQNHGVKARISWKSERNQNGKPRRYYVRWQTLACENKPPKDLSATTEQTSFELYELDFNCSYKVNVNKSSSKSRSPDSEIVVTVPDCQYLQKKVNSTRLSC